MPRLIALLTDFGHQGSFVGVMKGVIAGIAPEARVVDLNHSIPPQDLRRAALELKVHYSFFPKGTLFVAIVDPGVGSKREILFVKTQSHYFLAPDNGILSWLLEGDPAEEVIAVRNAQNFLPSVSRTFHGRDIFAPVAAHWARGVPQNRFGPPLRRYVRIPYPHPKIRAGAMLGVVLAVDRFGNLITNFSVEGVRRFCGTRFVLEAGPHRIAGLSRSYLDSQAANGHGLIAIEGSHGYLEISRPMGSAEAVLESGVGTPVRLIRR